MACGSYEAPLKATRLSHGRRWLRKLALDHYSACRAADGHRGAQLRAHARVSVFYVCVCVCAPTARARACVCAVLALTPKCLQRTRRKDPVG